MSKKSNHYLKLINDGVVVLSLGLNNFKYSTDNVRINDSFYFDV